MLTLVQISSFLELCWLFIDALLVVRNSIVVYNCLLQNNVHASASTEQVAVCGYGARQRARSQHRVIRSVGIHHQLEQGYRSVSTRTYINNL